MNKLRRTDDDIDVSEPEIEIEVVDDTPEEDRGKKIADLNSPIEDDNDAEIQGVSKRVKDRIATLTARFHQERRAKELAARQIDEQTNIIKKTVDERNKLAELVNRGEGVWKETNKSKVEAQLANARREFREAYEAGEAEKLADAQQKITKFTVELDNTNRWTPQPLRRLEVPAPAPQAKASDPKADDWHSKNQWFGNDNRMTAYSLGLHQELVEKGVRPDTDEYYSSIDREMRNTFPDKFPKSYGNGSGSRASVVAPASRGTNTGSRRVVRLTKSQEDIAKRLGVSNEEYAKEMLKIND